MIGQLLCKLGIHDTVVWKDGVENIRQEGTWPERWKEEWRLRTICTRCGLNQEVGPAKVVEKETAA